MECTGRLPGRCPAAQTQGRVCWPFGRAGLDPERELSRLVTDFVTTCQELTGSVPFSRGHKKTQNRCPKLSLSKRSSRLLRFLWARERDNSVLRIALLSRNRLTVE